MSMAESITGFRNSVFTRMARRETVAMKGALLQGLENSGHLNSAGLALQAHENSGNSTAVTYFVCFCWFFL